SEHHPLPLHPLAAEGEMEMTFLNGLARVLARLRLPSAAVPQHHRAATIFSPGNDALELAIIEWMILGPNRKALVVGIERRPLGHGPALQHPIQFKAEVPVQPRRIMLLD